MDTLEQVCANCFYGRELDEEMGAIECHRNPPTARFVREFFDSDGIMILLPHVMTEERGIKIDKEPKSEIDDYARWPLCNIDDWCGEWKPENTK